MSLPTRLGRLERVDRLGVGGFATVWLYHDAELDSDVAIKALAENWSQRLDVRERFLEEARILRRADSDHIVRVYDIGEVDGTPYFVMTYADQGSLARHLSPAYRCPCRGSSTWSRRRAPGWRCCTSTASSTATSSRRTCCCAPAARPATGCWSPTSASPRRCCTRRGLTQVVGTPAYMAPEQATGGGIDVRADVHALAAVAYQMLTGRLAREGSISELAHATLPVAPSRLNPSLPGEVDEVLLRSLDPGPSARYPSMAAFVDALRARRCRSRPRGRQRPTTRYQTPDTAYAPLPAGPGTAPAPGAPDAAHVLVFAAAFAAAYAVATLVN